MSSNGMAKATPDAAREQTIRGRNIWNRWRFVMVLPFLFWCTWSPWFKRRAAEPSRVAVMRDEDVPDIGFPKDVLRNWAQYSPYIPAAQYVHPPPGCVVKQVNLLQRHGARWPTTKSGEEMEATVKKLKQVKHYKEDYLDFLKGFTWNFEANDLLPLGVTQSYNAGAGAFDRYSAVVTEDNPPFVRAAGSTRVVDSAAYWAAGFRAASYDEIDAEVDLVLPETGNLTLNDGMCPNSVEDAEESKTWLKIFAQSLNKRLNSAAPGAHLNNKDVHNLMSLCAFHSQVTMAPSPFCGLFSEDDFEGYEYHGDLSKFYSNGYGGYLGRVQGVGYVNELIARLTGKPVQDNTQTNRTLDGSEETFPLNRTFYADFSHDNEMVSVYSAIGLFHPHHPLDPTKPSRQRTWIASRLVPFSARMVVEKLECFGSPKGEFVRILVNDALQPLKFCGGVEGLCELDAFVESQGYARRGGDGDFEKCFDS